MKILYISPSIIPSRAANSIHVVNMCEAFNQLGYAVELYAKFDKKTDNLSEHLSTFYGVNFSNIKCVSLFGNFTRGMEFNLSVVAFLRFLWLFFSNNKPDFIFCRNLYAAFILNFIGRQSVLYETHAPEIGFRKRLQKYLLLAKNVKTIVISDALRNILVREYSIKQSSNINVLHDAARAGKKRAANDQKQVIRKQKLSSSLQNNDYKIIAGYFGHLYQGRGIEIIESLSVLHENVLFVVYGGNEKDLAAYKAKSVPNNLVFKGHIPPDQVFSAMQMMDVLLMPYQKSVSIGVDNVDTAKWMSPMKMFEYMSTGVPIISSNLPVLKEVLINEVNALLVEPNDVQQWSFALNKLIASSALQERLAKEAHINYLKEYTWTVRAEKALSLLKSNIDDEKA